MKKVIRQDGARKVFTLEGGEEIPFSDYGKREDKETRKSDKGVFNRAKDESE